MHSQNVACSFIEHFDHDGRLGHLVAGQLSRQWRLAKVVLFCINEQRFGTFLGSIWLASALVTATLVLWVTINFEGTERLACMSTVFLQNMLPMLVNCGGANIIIFRE